MLLLPNRIASSRQIRLCRSLGLSNYIYYLLQAWRLTRHSSSKPLFLRSRYSRHPLLCRPNTTDILVFDQVFIEREYQHLAHLRNPTLVIDCGANVGYSSACFLTQFSNATLLAVEPDPGNFALLKQNLAPFGPRARALKTAVWSHCTKLTLEDSTFRDGAEWSRQVRECRPGEDGFDAIDVGTLIEMNDGARVSLLKMDIEGAEAVVFERNFEPWIDKVDNIAIELHSDSLFGDARRIFFAAINGRGFETHEFGELTLCMRPN